LSCLVPQTFPLLPAGIRWGAVMVKSVPTLLFCAAAAFGRTAATMSRGTTFCHESDPFPASCWDQYNDVDSLPPCEVDMGVMPCKCPKQGDGTYLTARCDLQIGSATNPTPSYCKSLKTFNATTSQDKVVCEETYQVQTFPTRPVDSRRRGEASYMMSRRRRRWFGQWCDSGYTTGFTEDECVAKERYVGESCWDGWSSGACQQNGAQAYDETRLTCVDLVELESAAQTELHDPNARKGTASAKCVPGVHVYGGPRPQCTCSWDWYGFVACGASQCNGHACVLSTGDGNKYCDWSTTNDW